MKALVLEALGVRKIATDDEGVKTYNSFDEWSSVAKARWKEKRYLQKKN